MLYPSSHRIKIDCHAPQLLTCSGGTTIPCNAHYDISTAHKCCILPQCDNVVFHLVIPAIVRQPEHYFVQVGSSITLNCEASGPGDITYQWRQDNNLISNASESSLVISSIALDNGGVYHCEASNSRGETVQSTPSRVTVVGK